MWVEGRVGLDMEVGVGVGEPAGMTPMFEFNSPPASSFNNPLFLMDFRMELTENPLFRLFTLYYIKYFTRPKGAAIQDHSRTRSFTTTVDLPCVISLT